MAYGPQTPFLDPDNYLFGPYMAGELKNQSHVNDPVLGDLLIRQRRTADVAKRRELLHEIQRHAAKQQYYVYSPSGVYIGVWDAAVKNYVPNLGCAWGGRPLAGWPDRSPVLRRSPPKRPGAAIPPLIIASLIVSPLPRLLPGDAVQLMLEEKAYGKDVDDLRHKLG